MQSVASVKSKRGKEWVEDNEPSQKKAKYCMGCLAINKDTTNKNRKIKRIKIKEEKEGSVLPKCLWVQKETIVFYGDTLDTAFL